MLTIIYGIQFTSDPETSWSNQQKRVALSGVSAVDRKLRGLPELRGYGRGEAFKTVFGSVTFHRSSKTQWTDSDNNAHDIDYGAQTFGRTVEFYDDAFGVNPLDPKLRNNVVHELGHVFNYVTNENSDADPYADLGNALGNGLPRREDVRDGMNPYPYQQNTREGTMNTNSELFGDVFLNWTYGSFNSEEEGVQTSNWFNSQMSLWVSPTNP